jgi:hypothetical protein
LHTAHFRMKAAALLPPSLYNIKGFFRIILNAEFNKPEII